jgi:hypothetical protein
LHRGRSSEEMIYYCNQPLLLPCGSLLEVHPCFFVITLYNSTDIRTRMISGPGGI